MSKGDLLMWAALLDLHPLVGLQKASTHSTVLALEDKCLCSRNTNMDSLAHQKTA